MKPLEELDKICEGVMNKYGTIRTEVFNYDYDIQRALEKCIHEKRADVEMILNKYSNNGEQTLH